MSDTVEPAETATTAPLSNEGTPAATPVVNAADPAEVEKARKEAEQARMRAAQLENQLKEREAADAAARQKQLEEQEEFKQLYEQLKAQIDERDAKDAELARQAELQTATQDVFKEYPAEVVELAQTAGLALSEDTDEAKAALKTKLDAFKARVGSSNAPTPNNPRPQSPEAVNRDDLVKRAHPGAPSPMAEAAAKGDLTPQYQYISQLSAIQRMKEIAQNGN